MFTTGAKFEEHCFNISRRQIRLSPKTDKKSESHFRVLNLISIILFLFLLLGSEPNVMPFNYEIRKTFPSELVYLVPNR